MTFFMGMTEMRITFEWHWPDWVAVTDEDDRLVMRVVYFGPLIFGRHCIPEGE